MNWERVLIWALTAGLIFLWTVYHRRLTMEAVRRRDAESDRDERRRGA